ncbi:MAG: hypothetical protein EHM73_13140 [Chroococcales cyanobacterium metabat2.561]|nr:MAG: hypothetical protein EHM73_13140 [Chroococcales cyanobacterium metabat2.561]
MLPEERSRLLKIVNSQRTAPIDPEQEAHREWLKCLSLLWESIGKKIDGTNEEDKRFDAYTRIFSDVPLALLEPAIIRAISSNGKYQVVPTPGAVWDALRRNLEVRENEDILEVIQNWAQVQYDRCFVRFEVHHEN